MKHGTVASENETPPKLSRSSSLGVVGYLLHLMVPALLLGDFINAWLCRKIVFRPASLEAAVAGLSALWLFAGLGFFLLSQNKQHFVKRIHKPLLSIYVVYLALILMEAFLHSLAHTPPIPEINPPGAKALTTIDRAIVPGVSGTKTVTFNQLGLRGPMPPDHGPAYKIVAIGGSTTQCAILDDSEEWPHLLMDYMKASQDTRPVWVGNAGVPAFNTVHHLVLMQWLPGVLHIDMVVFLIGVNDLAASLAFEGAPTQALAERDAGFQRGLPPGTHWRSRYPFFERLRLFLLIRKACRNLFRRFRSPGSRYMSDLVAFRERRTASPVIPLPDLSTGLREYRARVLSLASQCQYLEVRCLFLAQPTMWRDDLSPREQSLLWAGDVGRQESPKGVCFSGRSGVGHGYVQSNSARCLPAVRVGVLRPRILCSKRHLGLLRRYAFQRGGISAGGGESQPLPAVQASVSPVTWSPLSQRITFFLTERDAAL